MDTITDLRSKYFTDLNDGAVQGYDTLLYNSNNQLVQMLSYENNQETDDARFYYKTSVDSLAYKIEEDVFNTGDKDQLFLTTNSLDNPACKLLWYCPFLSRLSGIADAVYAALPLLFDDPSTNADRYVPFVSKCIIGYQVYNNWGLENYTNSKFTYTYSADSLKLHANDKAYSSADYYFIKQPRRQ